MRVCALQRSVMVVFEEEEAKRAVLNAAKRGQMVDCPLEGPQDDAVPSGLKGKAGRGGAHTLPSALPSALHD